MAFKKLMTRTFGIVATVLFIALVCAVSWQVFTRQVLKSPSAWTGEFAQVCFVWVSFAGAAFVFGERGHIAVDFVARRLNDSIQRTIAVIVQIVIALFAALALIWGGARAVSIAWNQNLTALPMTIGVVYLILPIVGVAITVCAVIDAIAIATGVEDAYPDLDDGDEPRDLDALKAHAEANASMIKEA